MSRGMPPPVTQKQCSPIWRYARKHPIYRLRAAIIAAALIGIILYCLGMDRYQQTIVAMPWLIFSGLLALGDLLSWASRKLESPDEEPVWPTRFFMVCDVLLCGILWMFFVITTGVSAGGYGGPSQVCVAWAALVDLCCAAFHAISFWKELMARCRSKWLTEILGRPCPQCGFGRLVEASGPIGPHPHESFFAGPSTDTSRGGGVLTPQDVESHDAEECLIGSVIGSGSGYGSIDHPEQTLDQVERVVVGKGKKKASTGAKKDSLG